MQENLCKLKSQHLSVSICKTTVEYWQLVVGHISKTTYIMRALQKVRVKEKWLDVDDIRNNLIAMSSNHLEYFLRPLIPLLHGTLWHSFRYAW